MWVANQDLLRSAAHPFYTRRNQLLDEHGFDGHVEGLCQRFYAGDLRPGLDGAGLKTAYLFSLPAARRADRNRSRDAAVGPGTAAAARAVAMT